MARWEVLARVREAVLRRLEVARSEKMLGNSLEAAVVLEARGELGKLLEEYRADLPSLFIVSQVELGRVSEPIQPVESLPDLRLEIRRAEGEKCERCWNYRTDRGSHAAYPTLCGKCATTLEGLGPGEAS
jgi:isoleucyl-tRNA synthetase